MPRTPSVMSRPPYCVLTTERPFTETSDGSKTRSIRSKRLYHGVGALTLMMSGRLQTYRRLAGRSSRSIS